MPISQQLIGIGQQLLSGTPTSSEWNVVPITDIAWLNSRQHQYDVDMHYDCDQHYVPQVDGSGVGGISSGYYYWKARQGQYVAAGNIKTLLHFNNGTAGSSAWPDYSGGINEGPPIIDESGRSWTISGAYVCTEQAWKGVSSLYTPNQYWIQADYSEDFSFGSQDWCIEFQVYIPTGETNKIQVFEIGDSAWTYGYKLVVWYGWGLYFYVADDNGSTTYAIQYNDGTGEFWTPWLDTWVHVAVFGVSGTVYLTANGNVLNTESIANMPDPASAADSHFYLTKMEVF